MIVVIKNRGLGDCIIGLGAIKYLKQLFPEDEIVYLTPAWVTPLFTHTKNAYCTIRPMSYKWILSSKCKFIIELHQRGRNKRWLKFICALKKIPYYFHNHNEKTAYDDPSFPKSSIQRDLDALSHFFANNAKTLDLMFAPELIYPKENSNSKGIITLGLLATRATKQWPLSYFVSLAKLLKSTFPQIKIMAPVVAKDNTALTEQIKLQQAQDALELIRVKLEDLPQLLSESLLFIGNDSGPNHVAKSLNIPTITIFGPDGPPEWHPYDTNKHPYFYKQDLACRKASGTHFCGLKTCSTMDCLKYFSPLEVYFKAIELMQ